MKISLSEFHKIAFVWGGTGWHVTPIVSLIEQHKWEVKEYIWIGWGWDSLEEREAKKRGVPFFEIPIQRLGTTKSWKALLSPILLIQSIFRARKVLLQEKPKLVFSKWWPGSLAVGIAAWLLMIPLWIHESDTIPWRQNRILWFFANKVFLWFDTAMKYFQRRKVTVTGQILHPDIEKPAKDFIPWKTEKNHILVICWSQWSRNVFDAIAEYCDTLDVEWIILLWLLNTDSREKFNHFNNITLYDWIDAHTLWTVLRDTDLVITRGSATTLGEVDFFRIKKVMIPLPWSAKNHQYYNALWYKENKWDTLLEERDIENLQEVVVKTLSDVIINRSKEKELDFVR
jgi:UDP-N-acetylglucosamine--N-acetylmuramyl-(pentapeptide) pyrophosphoryl-undecaprenol N-acetylglucosamine transferase